MFFIAILSVTVMFGYYVTLYLRFKYLVWLGYRFLSGLSHRVDRKFLLRDTLVRAGISLLVLYLAGRVFRWFAFSLLDRKADAATSDLLWVAFIPVLLLAYMACRAAFREFVTVLGFKEKDWNWECPSLKFFQISPENMPEWSPRSKRASDGGGGRGFFSFLDIKCTPSDAEWDSYQQSNYDRMYH